MNPRTSMPLLAAAMLALCITRADAEDAETRQVRPKEVLTGLAEAAKSNRDLLVLVHRCEGRGEQAKTLSALANSPDLFRELAKDFAPVVLNLPKRCETEPEAARPAEDFSARYDCADGVVLLLFDRTGRAYFRQRCTPSDLPPNRAKLLEAGKLRAAREELFAKALKNKGDIRRELFARALRMIDGRLVEDYADRFEELQKMDPEDRSGALLDREIVRLISRARKLTQEAKSAEAGLREYDAFVTSRPGMPPQKLQRTLFERFLFRTAHSGARAAKASGERVAELESLMSISPGTEICAKIRKLLEAEKNDLKKAPAPAKTP